MTVKELKALFSKHSEEEHLCFELVENKLSRKNDLHAFLLLEKILPENSNSMIKHAEHEEIFLDFDLEELANVITESQIIELSRCGISCYESNNALSMHI